MVGLAILRELLIIGYSDLEIDSYLTPALTTIRQPSYGLRTRTAEILIKHLEKKTKLPAILSLESKLVVRDFFTSRKKE